MSRRMIDTVRGFTLIELLVVVVVIAIVTVLVAPSFRSTLDTQRVRSINAQLVTDLQLARTEATSRNVITRFSFASNSSITCYSIYNYTTGSDRCNCLNTPACTSPTLTEIKSVRIPRDTGVLVAPQAGQPWDLGFDNVNGALYKITMDILVPGTPEYRIRTFIDTARTLRTTVGLSGRPTVCAPVGSTMKEPAC